MHKLSWRFYHIVDSLREGISIEKSIDSNWITLFSGDGGLESRPKYLFIFPFFLFYDWNHPLVIDDSLNYKGVNDCWWFAQWSSQKKDRRNMLGKTGDHTSKFVLSPNITTTTASTEHDLILTKQRLILFH